MASIFISYRRADSQAITDRIHDRLAEAFGEAAVFKDVDDIPLGSDFRRVIETRVVNCDILLVIIGENWLTVHDDFGNRRLDNPGDFVRIEIEAGLDNIEILTIPVLVDNAFMPLERDLPDPLKGLAFRSAVTVRHDPDFHRDMNRVVRGLQLYLDASGKMYALLDIINETRQHSADWSELALLFDEAETVCSDFTNLQEIVQRERQILRASYAGRETRDRPVEKRASLEEIARKVFNVPADTEKAKNTVSEKSEGIAYDQYLRTGLRYLLTAAWIITLVFLITGAIVALEFVTGYEYYDKEEPNYNSTFDNVVSVLLLFDLLGVPVILWFIKDRGRKLVRNAFVFSILISTPLAVLSAQFLSDEAGMPVACYSWLAIFIIAIAVRTWHFRNQTEHRGG